MLTPEVRAKAGYYDTRLTELFDVLAETKDRTTQRQAVGELEIILRSVEKDKGFGVANAYAQVYQAMQRKTYG